MSRVIAFLRDLIDAGMPLDMAMMAAEKFEEAPPVLELSRGAVRTRKWREKKEADTVTGVTERHEASPNVTDVTSVTVSPVPSVSPTPPSTTLNPLPSEPKGSSGKTTRVREGRSVKSRRCPNAWMPSDTDLAVAKREGFTPGEIDRELAKIRDYEFRDTHSDWSAVFRNWMRRAAETRTRQSPQNDRPSRQPYAASHQGQSRADQRQRAALSVLGERGAFDDEDSGVGGVDAGRPAGALAIA